MEEKPGITPRVRLRHALILLSAVFVVGIAGYRLIEGWSFFESVYQTIITLTTVGFGYEHHLSWAGKLHTMFLLVFGVGAASYTAFVTAQLLVETEISQLLGGVRMDQKLKSVHNHVIVCGYGRVGRLISSEFQNRGASFVVIERNAQAIAERTGILVVVGDATEDATLQAARVETAHSLVCALSNEADNIYVVLSARQLNPKLFITARADTEGTESKLTRAGADRVVCPYRTGAVRMAITTLQPTVVDFMDVVEGDESTGLRLEEVKVVPGSYLIGHSLHDIDFRRRYGLTVIGIKHRDAPVIYNPPSHHPIEAGDILLVIGPPAKLTALVKQMVEPPRIGLERSE